MPSLRLHLPHVLSALVLFLGIGLMSSCGKSGWKKLSPEEVRRILPELTLLSANLNRDYVADSIRQAAYRAFFEERGYTLTDWDNTLAWYAQNDMPRYHNFFVVASDSLNHLVRVLQHRHDSILLIEDREQKRSGGVLDSANLLRLGLELYGKGQLVNRQFQLSPSTPYDSTYRAILSTQIHGLPSNGSNPFTLELQLHLSDSTSLRQSTKAHKAGNMLVQIDVPNGKRAVRLSGFLRGIVPSNTKKGYILADSLILKRIVHQTGTPPPTDVLPSTSIGTENTVIEEL